MSKFYPDTKRLFENLRGRKARYSPEDLAEEFEKYITETSKKIKLNWKQIIGNKQAKMAKMNADSSAEHRSMQDRPRYLTSLPDGLA